MTTPSEQIEPIVRLVVASLLQNAPPGPLGIPRPKAIRRQIVSTPGHEHLTPNIEQRAVNKIQMCLKALGSEPPPSPLEATAWEMFNRAARNADFGIVRAMDFLRCTLEQIPRDDDLAANPLHRQRR